MVQIRLSHPSQEKRRIDMRYHQKAVAITAVVFYMVLAITTACPAGSGANLVLNPSSAGITINKPTHRSAPEEKIAQPSKWPWIVLGGLAVGLIALLIGGGGGSGDTNDPNPSGEGNVSFEWPTASR
jgi:hypothetical protein